MKKILTTLIMCLMCLYLEAQSFNQTAAINEISAATASISSMKCDFVQTKSLKMLGNKMVSKGQMFCKQPDKLRWEYTSPYAYTFILNNNKILLRKGKHNDVIDVNQNKMFKEIAKIIMNNVMGQSLTNKKEFSVSVAPKDRYYLITLIPQKKEIKQLFSKVILHYDKKAAAIVTIELHEKNGDSTQIELQNINKNTAINASMFQIN